MSLKVAKEYLHVRDRLTRAQEIVGAGMEAYDANPLLQEAGDSLMMKIGEAANRLDRAGVAAPKGHAWSDAVGNRNWLIHQYDQIDRAITCSTLTTSLRTWAKALQPTFEDAAALLAADG